MLLERRLAPGKQTLPRKRKPVEVFVTTWAMVKKSNLRVPQMLHGLSPGDLKSYAGPWESGMGLKNQSKITCNLVVPTGQNTTGGLFFLPGSMPVLPSLCNNKQFAFQLCALILFLAITNSVTVNFQVCVF